MWDFLGECLWFLGKCFVWILCLSFLCAVVTSCDTRPTDPTSFVQAYPFCSEVARAITLAEFKQAHPQALENVGWRWARCFDDGPATYVFLDDKLIEVSSRHPLIQPFIDAAFDKWSKALGRPESEVIPPGMGNYGLTRHMQWYLARYDLEIAAGQIGRGKDAVFYAHCRARSKIHEVLQRPRQ